MYLRRTVPLTLAAVLFTTAACSVSHPNPPPPPNNDEYYRRMEKEAASTLQFLIQERDVGQRALTPEFVERLHTWSHRLADARVALSRTREQRIQAVTPYVEEMKKLNAVVENIRGIDPVPWPRGMTRYFVAEAELWLERVKNE
jgi:hypothetical protein